MKTAAASFLWVLVVAPLTMDVVWACVAIGVAFGVCAAKAYVRFSWRLPDRGGRGQA